VQFFRSEVYKHFVAHLVVSLDHNEVVHRLTLNQRLSELYENDGLVAVNSRQLEHLHDVFMHDFVIVSSAVVLSKAGHGTLQ
jgi:hypothetical protein